MRVGESDATCIVISRSFDQTLGRFTRGWYKQLNPEGDRATWPSYTEGVFREWKDDWVGKKER